MDSHIINLLQVFKMSRKKTDMIALVPYLDKEEYQQIEGARYRYACGDGPEFLEQACNKLIAKYRADIPPRTFKRTLL